jgi:hypothetical protein
MSTRYLIARNLAAAFLCGGWSVQNLVEQGREACGQRGRWLRVLAKRVVAEFVEKPGSDALEKLGLV